MRTYTTRALHSARSPSWKRGSHSHMACRRRLLLPLAALLLVLAALAGLVRSGSWLPPRWAVELGRSATVVPVAPWPPRPSTAGPSSSNTTVGPPPPPAPPLSPPSPSIASFVTNSTLATSSTPCQDMPSPYLQLHCGATAECTEMKRLLGQARFPRANDGCRHAMLVPPVKAYDAELIGSFFKPFGFGVSTNESTAAADPSQATWVYVPLPSDAVARLSEHDAARLAGRTLMVAGLNIGDKAGLCRIARRAEALWPSFAEVAPTPHCLNWPEDAAVAHAELHAGTAPWVFKDTAGSSVNGGGRTYGGLSVCFYSPRTDCTKQLVLNSEKKWAVLKSPPLRNWTSSWQAQLELRTSSSRRHPKWSRRRGVFQRLVRPLLYEERAHMFRIFVLVTSTLPLRAWWWRESYAMVAGRPYADALHTPDDPATTTAGICATIVNSGFEKEHCRKYRKKGYKLFIRRLSRFIPKAAESLELGKAELWRRIERAMLFVLLADASDVIGSRGQCLLALDMVIDENGHVVVLEANRTPGTTEDTAGRKRSMHAAWATMTGHLDGSGHKRRWRACPTNSTYGPACRIEKQLDEFARAVAANSTSTTAAVDGLRAGGLERALLFEHEREAARLAELAQEGGFEPLYPKSAATLRDTDGHLQLLHNSSAQPKDDVPRARVAATAHALLLRYFEWKERRSLPEAPSLPWSHTKSHTFDMPLA